MKLHEISTALAKLEQILDKEEDINAYLDGVKMQLEEKAKNIFFYMKKFDSNMDAVDKEIKRLQELKKYHQTRYNKLKDYISWSMQQGGIDKIESDLVSFSFRKSSSVEITDEKIISPEFVKEKVVKSIDKIAIKNALKEGKEVAGAMIKESKNLQIK